MKIEVGKTYLDSIGIHVRCVGIIPENKYWPYVCTLVTPHGLMKPFLVDINGDNEASLGITGVRVSRLMKEYKEPSYTWINVYGDNRIDDAYVSRKYADIAAERNIESNGPDSVRIGLIKVNLSTGKSENIPLEA